MNADLVSVILQKPIPLSLSDENTPSVVFPLDEKIEFSLSNERIVCIFVSSVHLEINLKSPPKEKNAGKECKKHYYDTKFSI